MCIPHTTPGLWPPDIHPTRMAALIERRDTAECQIALIGLADDLGIRLNNGRLGAREGPTAFRAALARYGVAAPQGWDWPRVFDAGDVVAAGGTEAAARRLERVLTNDPAMGVFRHVDAGYEDAQACAEEQGLDVPGRAW